MFIRKHSFKLPTSQLSKFLLTIALFAVGCAEHTVYLQDVHVEAPYASPPLFLSQENAEGDVRVAPRVSVTSGQKLGGRINGHSKVNDRGVYQLDTIPSGGGFKYIERVGVNKKEFQGRNFRWEPTNVNASLQVEYATSKRIALVGGFDFSSGSSQSYLGANLGMGFLFQSKSIGGRFDFGVQFASGKYYVDYVVATSRTGFEDAEVQFFTKEAKEMHAGYYSSFTFNTRFEGGVEAFLQLAINRQNLLDFSAGTMLVADYTVAQSASFFTITPGVVVSLSPSTRVMTGVRLGDETALLDADRGVLLAPFVQVEFGL
jgi:hypothetical protein